MTPYVNFNNGWASYDSIEAPSASSCTVTQVVVVTSHTRQKDNEDRHDDSNAGLNKSRPRSPRGTVSNREYKKELKTTYLFENFGADGRNGSPERPYAGRDEVPGNGVQLRLVGFWGFEVGEMEPCASIGLELEEGGSYNLPVQIADLVSLDFSTIYDATLLDIHVEGSFVQLPSEAYVALDEGHDIGHPKSIEQVYSR